MIDSAPHGIRCPVDRLVALDSAFHSCLNVSTASGSVRVAVSSASPMFLPRSASNLRFAGQSMTRALGMASRYPRSFSGFCVGSRNASLSAARRLVGMASPSRACAFWPSSLVSQRTSFHAASLCLLALATLQLTVRMMLARSLPRGIGAKSQSKSRMRRYSGTTQRPNGPAMPTRPVENTAEPVAILLRPLVSACSSLWRQARRRSSAAVAAGSSSAMRSKSVPTASAPSVKR